MTAGLIVNPKSGKGQRKGIILADKLKSHDDVDIVVLDRFEDLLPSLERMGAAGVSVLFISSGDGTIQQIQTDLAERGMFEELPALVLLPHGTTNMNAADVGLGIKDLDEQARIIADAGYREKRLIRKVRHTVRVANPADGRPRHGMFVGTGSVWRGTVFCQEAVHKTGLKGDFATFATLAAAVFKSLFAGKSDDRERLVRAYDMRIDAGDGRVFEGGQLMFLATTLEKLILGSRPFWGGKTTGLRASIFPYPPPNIVRWLWTSMYGPEDRRMPAGCHSFVSERIDIETDCPFVIDGEFFDPPAGEALRIETGPAFSYLCAA